MCFFSGGGSPAAIEWSKLMGTYSQDIVRNPQSMVTFPQENCKKVMFGEQITLFEEKTPTNCNSRQNKLNKIEDNGCCILLLS